MMALVLPSEEYSMNLVETLPHKLDVDASVRKCFCYVFRVCLQSLDPV